MRQLLMVFVVMILMVFVMVVVMIMLIVNLLADICGANFPQGRTLCPKGFSKFLGVVHTASTDFFRV